MAFEHEAAPRGVVYESLPSERLELVRRPRRAA
jgi:hypothetical protein